MQRLIITMDGPAGSGKSTVARQLAARLGVEFLDTGAMYRGLTALCVDQGVDPEAEPSQAAALAADAHLHFDWSQDPPRLYVNDRDVNHRLRDTDVTSRVSALASIGEVRKVLVAAQQRIGEAHPRLVTEGRDQGSVVFPNACVKFYLDAEPPVRARRRADQLRALGREANEADILDQLVQRDERDAARKTGPLTCPEDAHKLDTTNMTLDAVVDYCEQYVRQQVDPEVGCVRSAGGASGGAT